MPPSSAKDASECHFYSAEGCHFYPALTSPEIDNIYYVKSPSLTGRFLFSADKRAL
jgi:hypothetical protein